MTSSHHDVNGSSRPSRSRSIRPRPCSHGSVRPGAGGSQWATIIGKYWWNPRAIGHSGLWTRRRFHAISRTYRLARLRRCSYAVGVGARRRMRRPGRPTCGHDDRDPPRTAILKDARDTVRLAATVEDQHGRVMKGVPVSWSSGNSVVAQVSIDGLVTGEEVGTLTAHASTGEVTANATIVVNPGPRAVLHKVYRGDGRERLGEQQQLEDGSTGRQLARCPHGQSRDHGADALGEWADRPHPLRTRQPP